MKIENTEGSPQEVAGEILEALEGKSYGFIKSVCESIMSVLDIICIVPIDEEPKK